ncbi:hypothetical protein IFM89_038291 [Coptis chinensis]|uniref:Pentatricopeptide repeat-containing protein n=1 Tax=Coptis chinensis TaxID=261450 RepID=A0A835H1V4_9MAGN|nr:hypothetical protein IFM89_038291 [Coptis chinensis]
MSSSLSRLHRIFASPSSKPLANPTAPTRKDLIDNLFKEKTLAILVENFKKLSARPWFRKNDKIYVKVIRRLALAKELPKIEEVLEHQKKFDDITNEGFAMRLISLYGKAGMFRHAFKLFDDMPELKCARSVKSFNTLLNATIQSKNFDKTEKLFRELSSRLSMTPDHYSYNIVIKAFCEMGSLDSAVLMLDEMEKNGVNPDLVSFNTILNGFIKWSFSDGERIWARMEETGIVPNIISFNAKLQGLVNGSKISEAVELAKQLQSREVKPDHGTYNILIKCCCDVGNLDEAKRLYDQFLKSDFAPNWTTYEALIPCVCEKGDFNLALKLSQECLGSNCYLNADTVQVVVDGLVKESKVEEAKKLVELKSSTNCGHWNLGMRQEDE